MLDIKKQSSLYIYQCIAIVVILNLGVYAAQHIWGLHGVQMPMVVSALFVLVIGITSALVWRWVALKHQDMLATFYTSVSGFRFLLALIVMVVWYLAIGRQNMMNFFVIFLIYYMVSLTHHSIFFSKLSNRF